jgi:hypothetical protein
MRMSYTATDPKTQYCYAIASADPDFATETAKEIKRWKKDGAIIELLTSEEAVNKMLASINSEPKQCILTI